ncbi:MAG TPA: PIN domain-containing protein [Conexibacter sp.]|nr:PIN domain-containing protein [Conexibacter sp.]
MTLTDAGPLIALIDADDPDHTRCRDTLDRLRLPLLTTWPAFTEAMYLLERAAGSPGQRALWQWLLREQLVVTAPSEAGIARAARLMEAYADRPMDLADATLVALAEEREILRVFTLDSDFHVYRYKGRRRFDVVPE